MKDKEIVLKVNTLNEEEKLKLWLEYVVETSILNHNYDIEVGKPLYYKENRKHHPILNLTIFKYMEGTCRHRVTPFEKWVKQDENNHDLTGIYHFYRLKQMRKNERTTSKRILQKNIRKSSKRRNVRSRRVSVRNRFYRRFCCRRKRI